MQQTENEQNLIEYIKYLNDQRTNLEFQVMSLNKKLNDLQDKTTEAVEVVPVQAA